MNAFQKTTPKNNIDKILDQSLGLFRTPSLEQMESARQRVLQRLESETGDAIQEKLLDFSPARSVWRLWPAFTAIAAAIALAVLVWSSGAPAVLETANGSRNIGYGEAVRSNDGTGTVLTLRDGSRIEMRSKTELSLEAAGDGVRIRLNDGSVIVTAAKQRSGHLYVQTKDVTVSVVGTVFLVNAEKGGSRVAVVQGEVHVQQGPTEKKLRPGEQVATNPLMWSYSVSEEISWSRNAVEHLALLQQSAPPAPTPARLEFEVVSLRPIPKSAPIPGSADRLFRCKGVDGIFNATTGNIINLSVLSSSLAALPASSAVPQGRCIGIVHPTQLVAQAYGVLPVRITSTALAEWPEYYQIEAKAPDPANVTREQIRGMLQSLLADRFAFKMHIETTEGPGYNLRVGKNGPKFKEASGEEELLAPTISNGANGSTILTFNGKFRLKTFAESLWTFAGRVPVIDKTDLPGVYDLTLSLEFGGGGNESATRSGGGPAGGGRPGFSAELQDQLGLVLESTMVPVDYIIVDHIEKPLEN